MTEKSAAFCKKSKYSVVDLLGQKNPHSSKSGSGTVQLNKLFFSWHRWMSLLLPLLLLYNGRLQV